ncbi:MAG: hypothetical protein FJ271_00865 [Planctomycetes bacterium]|nr:hypothetical protein [Planctomycetota bacterium]
MNRDYLATHGQSNHLGRFVAIEPLELKRGDRVVIETGRGLEIGTILCGASDNHVRLLRIPPGRLVRRTTADDERTLLDTRKSSDRLFAMVRSLSDELALDVEILDVEVLLDAVTVVQFLGAQSEAQALAAALADRHGLAVLMENLAAMPDDPVEAGCGKPDCGQGKEGGCTSCSSGGCSTGGCATGCATGCGTGGTRVDMRDYFAHLRGKMESRRVPLA